MAIRMMTTREAYEADPTDIEVVTNYPGHEAGTVNHGRDCPHVAQRELDRSGVKSPECNACCHVMEPLYMRTFARGLVVAEYEVNGSSDSDFHAVHYNPATDKFEDTCWGTTRGWTYPNGACVDAPEELRARWFTFKAESDRKFGEALHDIAQRRAYGDNWRLKRGDTVEVVKGRKVPLGTKGECCWVGDGKFGRRCGVKDAAGTVWWTAISNVQIVA